MTDKITPVRLTRPSALLLSRVDERLSFLYLDRCAVHQDDNGTVAVVQTDQGRRSTQIPVATLTCLLLGPGTSITQQAMASLSRVGCGVSFVGAGAIRSYGAFLSPYAPTDRLQQQAKMATDPQLRVETARRMYVKRFPGTSSATFADGTIEQLRGIEGIRMRGVYQQHAKKQRLRGWRRNTGTIPHDGPPDNVNRALNSANSALYGVVNAVVLALGLSPGLGVIHTGNRQSFTLDIADLYKTNVTIPLAFSLHQDTDAETTILRKLRDGLRLVRMLPQIITDIDEVLGLPVTHDPDEWDIDSLRLWGPRGEVEGNWSHAEWTS
ncbi:type I-E CRISPR-associated endonuclease Cas1e [Leekyejoonella antrihumi]|uniref:type I-E CRISPR-associated endonuclease Cas1e n=1 Tax=Leekyejoonella antrihumi TaxID=1660198 RepID=UPI00164882C2|nr:type I-E CRISPR-associated endonuclease Cas1e [Leekyejoonella antrihumi]